MAKDAIIPVRLPPSLRKQLEEMMKDHNIKGLGVGIRVGLRAGCTAIRLLKTGNYKYKIPEDPALRSIIDNLSYDDKQKLLEVLIQEVGVGYVNRLRAKNPDESGPQIVDKDGEEGAEGSE